MRYRIAVDVGGTFTDVVGVDETGAPTFVKTPSTPENQAIGVMDGVARLAEELGLGTAELLARTDRIIHGMTVATNALLERKGATVGLLTTEGHRDVLEMREGLKPERYNLRMPRRAPLVPRHLRLGVRERLRSDGRIETPLDPASLGAAIETLKQAGVTSVAVCYLHAYRDPTHEQMTRAALEAAMPGVYVSLSSDVLPQIKEFERVSTTVVNAYVGPLIQNYLGDLESRFREAGYAGPLLIILSHGGVAPVEEAVRVAAATALSGPAGGLAGAAQVARILDAPDLITFDVGGTSSDISLVLETKAALSKDREMANERIALPSLDIVTLGAGGGSIARVESNGLLEVGPQSAGSQPGPICYGRGGELPTITDASVVMGYLDPDAFAGGRMTLDRAGAEAAFGKLGAALGVSAIEAAEGVHRVAHTQFAEGVRLATVRRGVDPRRFALLGFGGAAGLHVTALAKMLSIGRVLVPRVASVLSAWGMLTTDIRLESVRTVVDETPDALGALFERMETDGRSRMQSWFDGSVAAERVAEMRYGEQIFEIDVPLEDLDFAAPDAMARLKTAFEGRHEALYAYALPDQDPVMVNARVAVVGALPDLPREPAAEGRATAAPLRTRSVYLDGWKDVPVFAFGALAPGQVVEGPALIESESTTVLLREGDRSTTTTEGWLDIAV